MLEILKNPIVIGIALFVIIFIYMYWTNKKKYDKDPSSEKAPINIMIPGVAGILGWFVASTLFGASVPTQTNIPTVKKMPVNPIIHPQGNMENVGTGSVEFHLLENNVKIPPTDVLIELAPQF